MFHIQAVAAANKKNMTLSPYNFRLKNSVRKGFLALGPNDEAILGPGEENSWSSMTYIKLCLYFSDTVPAFERSSYVRASVRTDVVNGLTLTVWHFSPSRCLTSLTGHTYTLSPRS